MKNSMFTLEWNGKVAERYKTGDVLLFKMTSKGVILQAIRKGVFIYFVKEKDGELRRENSLLLGDITFDVISSFVEVLAANVGGCLEYKKEDGAHCFEFVRRPKGCAIK